MAGLRHPNRPFPWAARCLCAAAIFFCWHREGARAAELPEQEPARGWHGTEFADTTASWLRKEHPDIKIFSGIDDFKMVQRKKSGEIHERAKLAEFLRASLPRAAATSDTLDLLAALGGGSRLELANDTRELEDLVRGWILSQPDNSIAPHVLLGHTISEAKGNVLRALAALWNLTSKEWKAAPMRTANPIAAKLVDPTGEAGLVDGTGRFVILPPGKGNGNTLYDLAYRVKFVVTKRGDKYSTYYHFLGTTLFSHYISARSGNQDLGRWLGSAGAKVEASYFGKTSGLPLERKKRIWNDIQGAKAGSRLFSITNGSAAPGPGNAPADVTAYLRPNPVFAKDYALEADGRPPAYFGLRSDPKYWSKPMDEDELRIRFAFATKRSGEIFDPVILASSSDGERLQHGLANYLRSGAKDPFLNKLIRNYYKGARGNLQFTNFDFSTALDRNRYHVNLAFPDYDVAEIKRRVDTLIQTIVDFDGSEGNRSRCSGWFSRLIFSRARDR